MRGDADWRVEPLCGRVKEAVDCSMGDRSRGERPDEVEVMAANSGMGMKSKKQLV